MAFFIFSHTFNIFSRSLSQSTPALSSIAPKRLLSPRIKAIKSCIRSTRSNIPINKAVDFHVAKLKAFARFKTTSAIFLILLKFITASITVIAIPNASTIFSEPPSLSAKSDVFCNQSLNKVNPFAPIESIF